MDAPLACSQIGGNLPNMSEHHYDSYRTPILFIADMHLDASRPAALHAFLSFLRKRAIKASALYILGDCFDAWIGDDARPADDPVAPALHALAQTGTAVYLMRGNRDFFLGQDFADAAGATLLNEPFTLNIDQTAVLIEHGDALCTDDHAYQAFRAQVRDPAWQAQFLALPIAERIQQAKAAQQQSQTHKAGTAMGIMDVNAQAVAERFRDYAVTRLIHGHTHRPAIHSLEVDGKPVERCVVGDWFEQGSVLSVWQGVYTLESLDLPA